MMRTMRVSSVHAQGATIHLVNQISRVPCHSQQQRPLVGHATGNLWSPWPQSQTHLEVVVLVLEYPGGPVCVHPLYALAIHVVRLNLDVDMPLQRDMAAWCMAYW